MVRLTTEQANTMWKVILNHKDLIEQNRDLEAIIYNMRLQHKGDSLSREELLILIKTLEEKNAAQSQMLGKNTRKIGFLKTENRLVIIGILGTVIYFILK